MKLGKRASDAYRSVMNGDGGTQGFVKTTGSKPTEADIKAAKFLTVIGRSEAAEVLKHLSEAESERVVHALADLDFVDPAEARALLAEFGAEMRSVRRPSTGGADVARDILVRTYGPEEGERRFYRFLPEERPRLFAFLDELSDRQIAALLGNESTAVLALVARHASAEAGARVLGAVPPEEKVRVVARLASMEAVERDVAAAVERELHERLKHALPVDDRALDGPGALAEILKHMDLSSEDAILASLRESDEELSESVKAHLTTVDDLVRLRDRDLQRVLHRLDDTDLAIFLKGKGDAIVEAVRRNVSTRRWELVTMNRETLGPMRKSDVDRITQEIMELIRSMGEAGEIVLRPGEEEYIG